MNTKIKTNLLLLLIASAISMLGCQKDDPKKPSSNTPQEQITTVIMITKHNISRSCCLIRVEKF